MKTKILIAGVLLIGLMVGGINEVSAQSSTIATMDADCNNSKEEYDPDENVYVEAFCVPSVGGNCEIWVCPCSFNDTVYPQNFSDTNCTSTGVWVDAGNTECRNLGAAGDYGSICQCFDVVINGWPWEIYGSPVDMGADGVDATGATCPTCVPSESAGFHIYPEAATIILVASGLFAIYGYARVRKKKQG